MAKLAGLLALATIHGAAIGAYHKLKTHTPQSLVERFNRPSDHFEAYRLSHPEFYSKVSRIRVTQNMAKKAKKAGMVKATKALKRVIKAEKKLLAPAKQRIRNRPRRKAFVGSQMPVRAGSSNVAVFKTALNNHYDVEYTEPVMSVNGSTGFSLTQFSLNPISELTFPWLSKISSNFDRFRWRYLEFYYRTLSGTIGSTQALGAVVMQTNYDPYDAAPTSRLAMEQMAGACSSAPNLSFSHRINAKTSQIMYIFNEATDNGDKRFTQIGTFNFATDAMPNTDAVGELWVRYKVSFYKPRVGNGLTLDTPFAVSTGAIVSGSKCWNSLTNIQSRTLVIANVDGNSFTLQGLTVGIEYLMTFTIDATNTVTWTPVVNAGSGATMTGRFVNSGGSPNAVDQMYAVEGTFHHAICVAYFRATDIGTTMTITGSPSIASSGTGYTQITIAACHNGNVSSSKKVALENNFNERLQSVERMLRRCVLDDSSSSADAQSYDLNPRLALNDVDCDQRLATLRRLQSSVLPPKIDQRSVGSRCG